MVPSVEVLAEMRDRGPVSAAIADLIEDPKLGHRETRSAVAQVKAAALADAASTVTGRIRVGKRTVTVTDVHVDDVGALVCTITHPDLPPEANPFRFVNPPICVPDETVIEQVENEDGMSYERAVSKEAPKTAFGQIVADAVKRVLGE